ncbi:creatininase family protein [Streptomyces canus]|uniref:creatininase family protein n=1 Tax=Streptomyces canus TaxID=58343 RepID=UPI0036C5A914
MSELEGNRLTAAELRALAARDAVVLLPIGATEQHGPHLPTGVDDFLAAEVCRRAAVPAGEHTGVVATPSLETVLGLQGVPGCPGPRRRRTSSCGIPGRSRPRSTESSTCHRLDR